MNNAQEHVTIQPSVYTFHWLLTVQRATHSGTYWRWNSRQVHIPQFRFPSVMKLLQKLLGLGIGYEMGTGREMEMRRGWKWG